MYKGVSFILDQAEFYQYWKKLDPGKWVEALKVLEKL